MLRATDNEALSEAIFGVFGRYKKGAGSRF